MDAYKPPWSCQLLVLTFVTSFKKDQPSFGFASPKVFSSLSFLINVTNSTLEADWKGGYFSIKSYFQSVFSAQVQIFLQSNVQWGPSMMSQKKSPRTAETMFKLFSVVQEYKRMTLQWNFTHLNYFQPMTGQQFSQKFNAVIALKERNADGWNFFDQMYPQLPLRQWGAGNIYLLAER